MESQSGPPVNEEFQNAALPAPYDSSISQGSISMSKGEFVIASSPMRRRPTTKRAMASTLIKRSVSSPNVGAMASNEASSTSMSDKRRNKLGYHRTSVACGHCRRRKIRCLLAPSDPQGRCSNCIRLKKECNFYPVDQQPTPEKRARSGSKAELSSSNDAETSTSSSPAHQGGSHMVEQVEAFHHFPPHPLQTNQDSQGYHPYSASTLSPPENTPMSGPGYEFSQHFDPSPSWENSPFLSHSPRGLAIERSLPEEASGAFWRQGGSSLPGAYHPSHFRVNESSISTSLSPQGSREAFGSQGGRDDRTWHHPPAPIRSMSLVTPEELPAHYQARYFHQPPFPARRVSATLGGSASSIYSHHTPDLATDSSTLGHHGHVEHAGGFSFPQWGTYPPQGAQTTESSTGYSSQQWYTASTNLDQVREEGSNPHTYQPAAGTSQYQRNPG